MVLRGSFRVFRDLHEGEANVKKTCKTTCKVAKATTKAKAARKSVIASRKSCSATGTGLSHYYILTDRKAK